MQELLVELDSVNQPGQYANPDARDAHYRFTSGELSARAGPLCRTPLNCSGRDFIHRTSRLIRYGEQHDLNGYVVGVTFVTRRVRGL
ncbi:hypothetical protein [Streptomyces sp. NPDC054786]